MKALDLGQAIKVAEDLRKVARRQRVFTSLGFHSHPMASHPFLVSLDLFFGEKADRFG